MPHWYSLYLLYWYRSTKTDATRAAVRDQKAFSFIELNDGSMPKGIQVVPERATTLCALKLLQHAAIRY